jgi:hypothetical protein
VIEPLARLGYASKAFIYATVGLLAGAAALHAGGRVTDTRGALRVILSHPFGNAVLLVLAVGLCGYSLWRVLDAVLDPDRRGSSAKGLTARIGGALRGLVYGALGVEAFRLARGLHASGGTDAKIRMWTAVVMHWPLGVWLIALVGLITAGHGVTEIVHAIRGKADHSRDLGSVRRTNRRLLMRISRFGVAARASIIVAIGVFLVRAALRHNANEAEGVRGSIIEMAGAGGRWVLAFIALGLIAYGVDQALHARYGRIRSPIR